jgi:hypothetical protein
VAVFPAACFIEFIRTLADLVFFSDILKHCPLALMPQDLRCRGSMTTMRLKFATVLLNAGWFSSISALRAAWSIPCKLWGPRKTNQRNEKVTNTGG